MKREKKYKIKEDKSTLEYELVIVRETDNNRKKKKKKMKKPSLERCIVNSSCILNNICVCFLLSTPYFSKIIRCNLNLISLLFVFVKQLNLAD